MVTTFQLDDRQMSLENPVSILSLLSQEKRRLFRPQSFEEARWINNPRCPLVNLIEVDGQVVPIAVWADRPVRDGMVIRTRSEQLESVLQNGSATFGTTNNANSFASFKSSSRPRPNRAG